MPLIPDHALRLHLQVTPMKSVFSFFAAVLLLPMINDVCCADLVGHTVLSTYVADSGSRALSFGGVLADSAGNRLTGSYSLAFDVYDSASGGSPLFSETISSSVQNGVVSTQIGFTNPLGSVLDNYDGTNRFLELSVGGNSVGRVGIDSSWQSLTGTGFQVSNATSVSPYVAEVGSRMLSFGGTLTDASGNRLSGNYSLQFAVYDSPSGGTPLFNETAAVSVQNGVISEQIGLVDPLGNALDSFNGDNRFLEVSVNGNSAGRVGLNDAGKTLSASGFQIEGATTISTYTAEIGERTLSFGGMFLDNMGNPLSGNHSFQFNVFDSSSGGAQLFSESFSALAQDGVVSAQLGLINPLDGVLDDYDGFNRYLSVTVDGVDQGRFSLNSSTGFALQAIPEPSPLLLFPVVGCIVVFTQLLKTAQNHRMHGSGGGQRILKSTSSPAAP